MKLSFGEPGSIADEGSLRLAGRRSLLDAMMRMGRAELGDLLSAVRHRTGL